MRGVLLYSNQVIGSWLQLHPADHVATQRCNLPNYSCEVTRPASRCHGVAALSRSKEVPSIAARPFTSMLRL